MVRIELDSRYILPIVIGVAIFVTDYIFGWLTIILGPIPMLFVLALILGIIARDVEDATLETIVSLAVGIGICAVLQSFVFETIISGNNTPLDLLFQAAIYATRGPLQFFTTQVIIGDLIFFVLLFTPFHYFFAPGFSTIGAKIGIYLDSKRVKPAGGTNVSSPSILDDRAMVPKS